MTGTDRSGNCVVAGREAELTRLRALLDGLPDSGGQVVLVRGEAGIGKSTLVESFADEAASRAAVFKGWCDPLGTPQPLGPVRDIARASPSVAAALQGGQRTTVMEALLALLSASDRPAVLVIEDVQWADEATLDVLWFLGRRAATTHSLLVLTYRDHEVDFEHPLRQIVGELPPGNLHRISLPPLSLDAIATLADSLPTEPADLLTLTGGNPLFVTEVLATGALDVPRSIEDAVLSRLSALSPSGRQVAEMVSIHPGGIEWSLLETLLSPPVELDDAVRRGLLRVDDDGVRYRHEIQRRAVDASLPGGRRRDLHRQVLAHLPGDGDADADADAARLVHHARAAKDEEALLTYGARAAKAAVATSSHREAISHFRSLEHLIHTLPAAEAADLAESWLRTAKLFGYPDDAVTAMTHAFTHRLRGSDRAGTARALAIGAMVLENSGRPREADEAARKAIDLLAELPAGSDLAYALTERTRLHLLRGDYDQLHELQGLDRAISAAEAVGDDRNAANALTLKGIFLHNARDPRGLPLIERAHELAARGGHRFEETEALSILAGKTADVRDLGRALDLNERGLDTAASYELRPQETFARVMRAELLMWVGDWRTAEDEANELLNMRLDVEPTAARVLATLAMRQRGAAGAAAVRHAWSLARRWDQLRLLDPAAGVVAENLWLTGEDDPEWLAELDEVLARGLRGGAAWPSGTFAFWMWKLGRLSDIPASVQDWYRWTMDGQPERAAAFWARQGAGYDQAIALLHGTDAQALEALRIVEDLGADATARRFRRVLLDRGVPTPRGTSRASRTHPAGLTARQAEVMALLAEGLGNADIADRLFLSSRTVENHVTAILHKLDASSRHAAVENAHRLGLLDVH